VLDCAHLNSRISVPTQKASYHLPTEVLEPIRGSALFYPCSGHDLDGPIRLFAPAVSDFLFIDIRRPRRPALGDFARPLIGPRQPEGPDVFVHLESGQDFRLHRIQCRGEDYLRELAQIGVFFFRGDTLATGEGSSGIPWFGRELLCRVLGLLIPNGLIVTDGSNVDRDGPQRLADFRYNRDVREAAASAALPFDFGGRHFRCVGYAGEKNGPTLVWQVD
jgi:hypothetical protein